MQTFDCPHCHRVFDSEPGENEVVTCPHCNSAVALPEKDLPPGTVIGGFEILRLLGHGGMGNVYLANQISMNRPVALKILLKSMTQDKESVKQFLNEVRVSGKLNHRNIITAIDAGEIEDTYYLVTTYVDGMDLEKRLEEEKIIPEKEALKIVIKIADALQYAWENHGLLHKDIKPGNIMVDSNKEVYLMDMGIAQFIGETPSQDEHILGSPFFMSPEQTRGERLSWTSDLYSLGATLYNMVTGVPPYDADDVMKIIEMHSKAPFPPPSTRNPNAKVSKPTIAVLRKMLAKDPNSRYDSWGGLKEAVTKALRALDGKAAPQSAGAKKKKKTGPQKKASGKKPATRRRRRPPVKKQSGGGGFFIFLIFLIMFGIVGYAGYYFYKQNNEKNARAYLEHAEQYYSSHPEGFRNAVDYFRDAVARAKGTSLEARAKERLAVAQEEVKKQNELIRNYAEVEKEIVPLIKEKRYSDAIKMIQDAVKDIKETSVKLKADMYIKELRKKEKN